MRGSLFRNYGARAPCFASLGSVVLYPADEAWLALPDGG